MNRWRQRWRRDGEGQFVDVNRSDATNDPQDPVNPGLAVHMMSIHAEARHAVRRLPLSSKTRMAMASSMARSQMRLRSGVKIVTAPQTNIRPCVPAARQRHLRVTISLCCATRMVNAGSSGWKTKRGRRVLIQRSLVD